MLKLNLNKPHQNGLYGLHFLFIYNDVEDESEFQRLLMNGVNVNVTDERGTSALAQAAQRGNTNILVENKNSTRKHFNS